MLYKLCSNLWIKVKIFSYRINQTYVNFLVKLFIPNWAFLVAQIVKNPPAVWETWVWSLGWADPLEEDMAAHPRFLPGESHGQRSHRVAQSQTQLSDEAHPFSKVPQGQPCQISILYVSRKGFGLSSTFHWRIFPLRLPYHTCLCVYLFVCTGS